MSRNFLKYSLVVASLLVTALVAGCGTSNKEGNINLGNVARVDESACRVCHASTVDPASSTIIMQDFFASAHNEDSLGCQGCHGGGAQHNGVGPIPFPNPANDNRCVTCHADADIASLFEVVKGGFGVNNCSHCHTASGVAGVHGAKVTSTEDCVSCHAVAAPQHGTDLVNDNNGIRAITGAKGEFGGNVAKKSHHVVNADGSDPTSAQCLGCHAEGKIVRGAVLIDSNFHMKDGNIYLRNGGGIPAAQLATELGGNTSVKMKGATPFGAYSTVSVFPWNPVTPNHNLMDQFCFSCHNANGAPLAAGIGNTALNPFADTISNGYDQMQRGKVVNVYGQFDKANASHHAVRGKRYSGRTRAADARQILTPATFANTSSAAFNGVAYAAGKAGPGVRQTLFDAGFFSTTYVPLGTTATLGDDSLLHCGDCHTVGQSSNTNTTFNKAAIGAHGSVNEYMLRNSQGTDALHNAGRDNISPWNDAADDLTDITGVPSLVCYNCHAFSRYGAKGKHEGVNSSTDCNGDVWTNAAAGRIGIARLLRGAPFNSNGEGSNMFGIQCANCHNSGPAAQFGGIHGGNITYVDGTGTSQKPYRFLPGLGNVKYAPNNHMRNDGKTTFSQSLAETAAITAAANTNTVELTNTWEEKALFTGSRATCYTLNENPTGTMPAKGMTNPATDAYQAGQPILGTWGACSDHGGSSTAGGHGGTTNLIRPVGTALRDIQRPLTY